MIDLSRTRGELLAEIGAGDPASLPAMDILEVGIATEAARVSVLGHGSEDLFPFLNVVFSERYAAVPRLQLIRDLLMPLKHALGNALKHGNGGDPAMTVSVEILLTLKGVLFAITDEGQGFDVPLTLRRLQEKGAYFKNHGTGFRNLHRATSAVSYENGGRTVLLCFRRAAADPDGSAGKPLGGGHASPELLDPAWVQTCLRDALPELGEGRSRIESCRVYAVGGPGRDDSRYRCVLRLACAGGRTPQTRVLSARIHSTEEAAEADLEAASRLQEVRFSESVRVLRPVARLAGEPTLVLYDLNPLMDLREYLSYRGSLKSLRHCARRFGEALGCLHRSRIVLPRPGHERSARRRPSVPTLGGFSWDDVYYGVNNRFYLSRFEACRRSDPGIDLGGFAAELLSFIHTRFADEDREEVYRHCRTAFLEEYNSKAEHWVSEEDLGFYASLALCDCIRRAPPGTESPAGGLLRWLDRMALSGRAP